VTEDFLKGVIVGLLIAAPVGPIAVFCIRLSVAGGRWIGFVSGLGAATADTLFGLIAALGLGTFNRFLLAHRDPIQVIGGVFLAILGIRMLRSRPAPPDHQLAPPTGAGRAYWSTFALTVANPTTVLAFIGIFAGFGVATAAGGFAAAALVAGVFAGSTAWWLLLSTLAGRLGRRLQHGGLHRINQIGGALILALGLWYLARTLDPTLP
jgi:threonine/homoserine/homoserine lactone efflux protein